MSLKIAEPGRELTRVSRGAIASRRGEAEQDELADSATFAARVTELAELPTQKRTGALVKVREEGRTLRRVSSDLTRNAKHFEVVGQVFCLPGACTALVTMVATGTVAPLLIGIAVGGIFAWAVCESIADRLHQEKQQAVDSLERRQELERELRETVLPLPTPPGRKDAGQMGATEPSPISAGGVSETGSPGATG